MEKKYFVLHLLPPRPTFAMDMNEQERGIMEQHVAYWKDLMDKGFIIVYGPVMDPEGPYGLGIVVVDNDEQLHALMDNDPAAQINKYEFYPMRAIAKSQAG
jgi:uncharacterized protein YciI